MDDDAGDKGRQLVNALARGLEILRAFKPGDQSLGNYELAVRTGLPKPTVSRLTNTLLELNYLTEGPRVGTFTLGPGVLSLGYAVLAAMDLGERAAPLLSDLAEKTGASAVLAARDRFDVTYLRIQSGGGAVSVSLTLGAKTPIESAAEGRALLSTASARARRDVAEQLAAERGGEAGAFTRMLDEAADEFERGGFCSSIGGWSAEVNGVAAPIIFGDAEPRFALGVIAPAFSASSETCIEQFGPLVADAARRLSQLRPERQVAAAERGESGRRGAGSRKRRTA